MTPNTLPRTGTARVLTAAILLSAAPLAAQGDGPTTAASVAEATHREVLVSTPDEAVTLAGTFSLPVGNPAAPVVVFITGSGDHTRDQVISGTPMFADIAAHLLARGFATLRVDDRGTGASTGPTTRASTTGDRMADMRAVVAYLSREGYGGPIVLLGHSEGASIAANVARTGQGIAGVMLLGAPARSGADVWMDQQMAGITKHLGRPRPQLEEVERHLAGIIALSVGGAPAAKIEPATRTFFALLNLELGEAAETEMVDGFVKHVSDAWFRYFLAHDPTEDLSALTQPVLAVYGAIDALTSPALNAPPLVSALTVAANPDVTLRVVPAQDHFFLRAEHLPPGEHKFRQMHVAPELLELLALWLAERF
jgi:uncharacterized protein